MSWPCLTPGGWDAQPRGGGHRGCEPWLGSPQDCAWAAGCPLHLLRPSRGAWAGAPRRHGAGPDSRPLSSGVDRKPCPWRSPGTWALGEDQRRKERVPPGGGCQVEAGPGTCWRGRSRDSSWRGTGGSQAVLPQENCRHGHGPSILGCGPGPEHSRDTRTHTTSLLARRLGQHGRKRLWSQALAHAWTTGAKSLGSPLCRASWDLVTGRVAGSRAHPHPPWGRMTDGQSPGPEARRVSPPQPPCGPQPPRLHR